QATRLLLFRPLGRASREFPQARRHSIAESALTWLRSPTPSPERPWTEPPKFCPATTSACICCGATNCTAPLPFNRVPTHHSQ
ncbi:uncharacterized protein PODANS_1_17850, partial [Podospora anserina S mat+]